MYKNADLMWKQSVWTSTISSHLATKHLKDGGLLTLAGAKAALTGTPGNSISGHTAAYPHCNLGLPILHTILQPSRTGQVTCPCQRVDLQGNLARPKLAELFSQVSQAIPIAITELEPPPPPLSLSVFSPQGWWDMAWPRLLSISCARVWPGRTVASPPALLPLLFYRK